MIRKNRHLESFLISQDQHTSWRVYAARIFSSKHFEGFPKKRFLLQTSWRVYERNDYFSQTSLKYFWWNGFLFQTSWRVSDARVSEETISSPNLEGFLDFSPKRLKGFLMKPASSKHLEGFLKPGFLLPNILKGFWCKDFFQRINHVLPGNCLWFLD